MRVRDAKLKANRETPRALRLLAVADSIAELSIKNSKLMVENNSTAVNRVKSGERRKADLWSNEFVAVTNNASSGDERYAKYLAEVDAPVLKEYNDNMARKKLTSFTGGATGFAVGILTPLFSLFLMAMSVKPYEQSFKMRCIVGAYASQFLSSVVSGIAIHMMFDSILLAIFFGCVLFWCAPIVYESVARERQRLTAEFKVNYKSEIKEIEAALEEKERTVRREIEEKKEIEKSKRRKEIKSFAERTRMRNLLRTANNLVNSKKADPFASISTDPEKCAEWFVKNGEPYGLQIKLAEHCGQTKSSFGRLVEQKRELFSTNGKTNGNGKLVEHDHR